MENRDEIEIKEIRPEENVEEINLLDGESIKIELPSQDEIISRIDEDQMILEGKGSSSSIGRRASYHFFYISKVWQTKSHIEHFTLCSPQCDYST